MDQALAAHLAAQLGSGADKGPDLDDARLRRAADYIDAHLGEDLRLDTLAGEAGMSSFHFARAFKSATGRAPLQYIIAARIDRARILLRSSDLPVTEIAFRVGFGDPSRFARQFRKLTGQSPAAYRKG